MRNVTPPSPAAASALGALLALAAACRPPAPTPVPGSELVVEGRRLFFEETFDGNGRTCGTCHPASNNLTIDGPFIATLPAQDPLFVADTTPDLGRRFENNVLIRGVGLILENQDGFGDLENDFNMRGVPHTLGLPQSIDSRLGPQTGWSGDGAPGDGSLRAFATGAVIQHFTKTLARVPGVDFRLPTDEELDALEAFQLALGRREEIALPLPLASAVALRGQAIFNSPAEGKCFACHFNAGANGAPQVFGPGAGNLNFNTGVENLPDQPADLLGEKNPPDDGRGTPGSGEFNTPSLVEAADTPPFFHNNAVATLEGAVAFYNGEAFASSPAGQLLAQATGSGINLDATQVDAVAAFLRVVNAIENIRQSTGMLQAKADNVVLPTEDFAALTSRAVDEIDDAIIVLAGAGLHPDAVAHLRAARRLAGEAGRERRPAVKAREAIAELERTRGRLLTP
jgi:mono/diheme cytochrome c family protein